MLYKRRAHPVILASIPSRLDANPSRRRATTCSTRSRARAATDTPLRHAEAPAEQRAGSASTSGSSSGSLAPDRVAPTPGFRQGRITGEKLRRRNYSPPVVLGPS